MTIAPDSFHSWLTQQLTRSLHNKGKEVPFVVWYDPERAWRDLLLAAKDDSFEVWAEDLHELHLRERFYKEPRMPRIIWLPKSRDQISYFKVFELKASDVKEMRLEQAISCYGLDIPSDKSDELRPQLPYLLKEGFDQPKSDLKKILGPSPPVGDLLEILAASGIPLEKLVEKDLFQIFARSVREDFGLLTPDRDDPEGWREKVVAVLLCTEATELYKDSPPGDADRIIPEGRARKNALKLLTTWRNRIDLIDSFEDLVKRADYRTSLQYWAKSLQEFPLPLSSRCAERILFKEECRRLLAIDDFETLARFLDEHKATYQEHAKSFWGLRARDDSKVRWNLLVEMATMASHLYQNSKVEQGWKTPGEAISWFTSTGWEVDHAGESLFKENLEMPSELLGVRHELRKAYLRHLDRINSAFSELISYNGLESFSLPFSGDSLGEVLKSAKDPVAVLFLDAFRYDLGCRLADMLNQGEPAKRATVSTAMAPVPSITAIGMPFALPGIASKLCVQLPEKEGAFWQVTIEGFEGDLTDAEKRRQWLRDNHPLKKHSIMSITDLLELGQEAIKPKSLGKEVFLFGSEFDINGTDGQLKISGSDDNLERYAQAARRLRAGGYSTIAIVTDHGFFHWEPEKDEIEPKPDGEILWSSRRAVCGYDLHHPSALSLRATASDLECKIPRSVNAFRTYGGLGFFHGGATLQEVIIPVVIAKWPKKAQKIRAVLKPISQIISLAQRIEVAPGAPGQTTLCKLEEKARGINEKIIGRKVMIKVIHPDTGKVIFKSESEDIEPDGETKIVELKKLDGAEAPIDSILEIRLLDSDDEELLDRSNVTLKVVLDEWF
ncbi:MAG: PglZ domain protein [Methanosaeta sp. PtaU1.Bin060]|nr:MAG: PglZ domain protein [Methanosaeta sp. PtaU1.Bin060]